MKIIIIIIIIIASQKRRRVKLDECMGYLEHHACIQTAISYDCGGLFTDTGIIK
jgi:hypothetical protein